MLYNIKKTAYNIWNINITFVFLQCDFTIQICNAKLQCKDTK